MNHKSPTNCDILVVGGGFAGSVLAICLNRAGFFVQLLERNSHPRFAIGESSTPIADMILRDLSERYRVPELKKLSRYGSWQKHYPNLTCGIKRGFSYYTHHVHEPWQPEPGFQNELHVAASVNNQNSDTQWLRSEVDEFLFKLAGTYGVNTIEQTEITSVKKLPQGWDITAGSGASAQKFSAGLIVDATGSSTFSERFLGTKSGSGSFRTHSRALYSHFEDVPLWQKSLEKMGHKTARYPYTPDHSALHHLLETGWMWMLRFNTNLLSAGILVDQTGSRLSEEKTDPQQEWETILSFYPSLRDLFESASIAATPGKILGTGRLQRKLDRVYGPGWAALPHTAGFVDPLHSTGIAHTLKGVETVAAIIESSFGNRTRFLEKMNSYQDAVFSELELIDLLVACCYTSRHDFQLFNACTMLYFVCTVTYEQKRLSGQNNSHFLCADDRTLRTIAVQSYKKIRAIADRKDSASPTSKRQFIEDLKRKIAPYNTVGLMDDSKQNMYRHTAVEMK